MKRMAKRSAPLLLAGAVIIALAGVALGDRYISGIVWPEPPVVTPGSDNAAPSDAVVLFDGKDFSAWKGAEKWIADADGGFTCKGVIETKQSFGDCQIHVEFASPKEAKGSGQGRGNNGIGLMGARYEIQVLDSYQNPTYFEGQAASVYNQHPPMVNTFYDQPSKYVKHAEKLPLVLMYHGDKVRFRNIWVRDIKELEPKPAAKK